MDARLAEAGGQGRALLVGARQQEPPAASRMSGLAVDGFENRFGALLQQVLGHPHAQRLGFRQWRPPSARSNWVPSGWPTRPRSHSWSPSRMA